MLELPGITEVRVNRAQAIVQKFGDLVSEIAAASAEQATGIDLVNQAITRIDEMTQQNASLAEQTSGASAGMGDNARELVSTVGFFKTR